MQQLQAVFLVECPPLFAWFRSEVVASSTSSAYSPATRLCGQLMKVLQRVETGSCLPWVAQSLPCQRAGH